MNYSAEYERHPLVRDFRSRTRKFPAFFRWDTCTAHMLWTRMATEYGFSTNQDDQTNAIDAYSEAGK
jgi:hypothetical protein